MRDLRACGWILLPAVFIAGCGSEQVEMGGAAAAAPRSPSLSVQAYAKHALKPSAEVHRWSLRANGIAQLVARLYVIADGVAEPTHETVLTWSDWPESATATGDLVLLSQHGGPFGARDKRFCAMSIDFQGVEPPSIASKSTLKLLPANVPMAASTATHDGDIGVMQPAIVYREVLKPEGTESWTMSNNIDSMVEASKEGITIVALSVEWKPRNKP